MKLRMPVLLALLLLVIPALVLAQAQGRVKGTVLDSQGNPITHAKVTITCPDIPRFHQERTVDEDGVFRVALVDATWDYVFEVVAEGYQTVKRVERPLPFGQLMELEFEMLSVEELTAAAEQEALEAPGIKQLHEARELIEAGNNAEARAKLAEGIEARSDYHLLYLELGNLDLREGNYAGALANAEKCLEYRQTATPCLGLAANSAKELGNMEKHEKYMKLYAAANPDDPNILFNQAVERLNARDDAGAKPILEQVIQIDPNHPDGLYQLGMVYLRSGDSPKAKELLERFLEAAPDHVEAETARQMLPYL